MDNKLKTIEELAKEKYLRVQLRWEEMCVENATTEELIKARDFINNELNKREIIYCDRKCGNLKCIRNKDHIKTDYAFYGDFRFCEEWKPKQAESEE